MNETGKFKVGDVIGMPNGSIWEVLKVGPGGTTVKPVGGGKSTTISSRAEVAILSSDERRNAMKKTNNNSAKPKAYGKFAATRLSRTLSLAGWSFKTIWGAFGELGVDHISKGSVRSCMSDKRLAPYELTKTDEKKLGVVKRKVEKALAAEPKPKPKAPAKKTKAAKPITKPAKKAVAKKRTKKSVEQELIDVLSA